MIDLINNYECKIVGEMGLSRSDFMEMDVHEARMLVQARAESIKSKSELDKWVMMNALYNFYRKKGSKEIPLYGKPKKFKSKEAMHKEQEDFWKIVQSLNEGTFIEDKD